ncbi:MAG: HAMP domain-containing histidine kinase [Proteobacteria bacterium]|nr:HAMP domain-containing histidine kinase [Desulfobacteraceae bacterium]MBU4066693.1 HAMP domain-containing histidine kinase [Pseudomonadota bacterium]MBU4102033.1 HAMP domain-containing histidine kinase [Pseudomonadota bacterium]MBU4128158.1 HAMP domain-containing histidine kinase [Pseudomonadota bacterium]
MISLKDMKIQTKIIMAMVLLLIFIGLLSFWASYMHEKKSLLTNMQHNAVILNHALIISITNQKSIAEKVNLQTLVEELSLTEGIFGVWVIDNSSRITSATFREQAGEVASSYLISDALQNGYYVSGFDTKLGEQVYSAIYPLKKGNKILGAVEVAFELREYLNAQTSHRIHLAAQMKRDIRIMAESLSSSIEKMQYINELIHIQRLVDRLCAESEIISRIMIVDDNSRTIACNDLSRVGTIADDKGVKAVINGADIYTRLAPSQKIYLVDMPLRIGDEFKGVVSIGYDARDYYTHLSEIFRFGSLISGIGVLMGILLAFQVSNPIIKPIQRLTDVTKKLARGDLTVKASVSSRDEIGTLAIAFNQMAEDLARSKEEIYQYSKTLEQKVKQRTQELELSNQELREIQNELMEASMAKSEFMSIASHELRTPLTSVLGYSELLLTRDLTESQKKEFFGFINEESVLLSKIIDDLLDISRIESQKAFGFVKKPVNLADILLKDTKYYSRAEIGRRIITDMEENLPLVNADEEKIGQVIKNLIDNAIKYSPSGDIIAKAFVKDNKVWIAIQDHGIGISQKDIPHVFDKFFRVKQKETAHISGTGLGLAIVKYIVEFHDGELDIKSKLGEGTTIGFGLPVLKDRDLNE